MAHESKSKSVDVNSVTPRQTAPDWETRLAKKISEKDDFAIQFSELMAAVTKKVQSDGLCPLHLVVDEVRYYFSYLGMERSYFEQLTADTIANHVLCLYASKTFSTLSGGPFGLDLRREAAVDALYICNSTATMSVEDQIMPPSYEIERRIELKFLSESKGAAWETMAAPQDNRDALTEQSQGLGHADEATATTTPINPDDTFRVKCYRTSSFVSHTIRVYLWFFFVERATFRVPRPETTFENFFAKASLDDVGNERYMESSSDEDKGVKQKLLFEASKRIGPRLVLVADEKDATKGRLLACYRSNSTYGYFSTLTSLVKSHKGMLLTKKELEPCHGYTIVDCHISAPNIAEQWSKVLPAEASLLYTVPATNYSYLFHYGSLTASEVTYCSVAQLFVFYFVEKQSAAAEAQYSELEKKLRDESGVSKLHSLIRTHELTSWSEARIKDAMVRNVGMVKLLWADFDARHHPTIADTPDNQQSRDSAMLKAIKAIEDDFDQEVLRACMQFNGMVKYTNMYREGKSALVFDINPDCIATQTRRFPARPFYILMVVGSDFRGFHIRFNDIARGGVRLIVSRSQGEWAKNAAELFSENYKLAHTQQKKNKDIPEGGSKGIILMDAKKTHADSMGPFSRYMDAVLDMILPEEGRTVNNRPEDFIFIGPDENTADKMDWASRYAKQRGYRLWKAYTTGKAPQMGGIPHDTYGMTTRSVHQYVLGGLDRLGLKEEEVTKCQTGGPDGDLGSNEILISKDKTVSIVDGSGVIYDPNGLDRVELTRLATERKMIVHFDASKLGSGGFKILIEEKDVTLPNGELVEDGMKFRNTFHLHPLFKADIFVPCGGRPDAVNMSNIDTFKSIKGDDGSSKPRFKLIVEGANLFITPDARLILERQGILLFKDSSANKGGVTSSSMEVQAAIALKDSEHDKLMCTPPGGEAPEFYQSYAKEVQRRVERNARLEFECLWREKLRTNTPVSILGDQVSKKINELAASIRASPLLYSRDTALRAKILEKAVPSLLLESAGGVDGFLERVPEAYCQWIFATFLASLYVYSRGLDTTEFTFMSFVTEIRKGTIELK